MNLEQFAKRAGVMIIECDPAWGGDIGYREKGSPNCTVCGFKSEKAAYKHWLVDTFGKHTAKAVLFLLEKP